MSQKKLSYSLITKKNEQYPFSKVGYLEAKKVIKLYNGEICYARIDLDDVIKFVGQSWEKFSLAEKEKVIKNFIK